MSYDRDWLISDEDYADWDAAKRRERECAVLPSKPTGWWQRLLQPLPWPFRRSGQRPHR